MAAFDLVVLLARLPRLATALHRQAVVMHIDPDLLARQTRELGGEHVRIVGLAQVNGGRPPLRPVGRKAFESVLNANQIAERVPARIDHEPIVARPSEWSGAEAVC